MTGEIKKSESLYLKGLAPSDVRDGALFVNNPMLFINKVFLFVLNRSLISAISSLKGNYSFPVWECLTPRLGAKHSQAGNNRSLFLFGLTIVASLDV
jgi:hypothetical protein